MCGVMFWGTSCGIWKWRVKLLRKCKMYAESGVLEGEKSKGFNTQYGVVQGCSLSPIVFFVNDLLKEGWAWYIDKYKRISCFQMILLALVIQ